MWTPLKTGYAHYVDNSRSWETLTSAFNEGDYNTYSPYCSAGFQSARKSFNIGQYISVASGQTLGQGDTMGTVGKLDATGTIMENQLPYSIEMSGWVWTDKVYLQAIPFVLWDASPTFTSNFLDSGDFDVSWCPPSFVDRYTNGSFHCWQTKLVVETNNNSTYEPFAGVMFLNTGTTSITAWKAWTEFSARVDGHAIQTYETGR
jgi:hypothetical protein